MKGFIFGLSDGIIFGLALIYGLSTLNISNIFLIFLIGAITNSISNGASYANENIFSSFEEVHKYKVSLGIKRPISKHFTKDLKGGFSVTISTFIGSLIPLIPYIFFQNLLGKILASVIAIIIIGVEVMRHRDEESLYTFLYIAGITIMIAILVFIISFVISKYVSTNV